MLRSVIAIAVAVVAGALPTLPAHAAPARVVALGDSYIAGIGAGSYTVTDGCRRSSRSYAADAARRTKSRLTDLSCPGATVPDVRTQATRVPANAAAVVVQVGGNDLGFSRLAMSCLVPGQSTCVQDVTEAQTQLPALAAGLAEIIAEVRTRAPGARIALAGYPALLSSVAACSASPLGFLLDADEVSAVIDLQAQLDATIATTARAQGATFIDWPRAVDRHSACSPDSWIVTPLSGPVEDSLHPTAKANASMGRQVAAFIRGG